MIYFMQAVDGGPVKIGHSGDVDKRQRELECLYDRKLVVLATREGGRQEEAEVHARFAHLRLGKTEQFRPTTELMEFVGFPMLVSDNPNAIEAMPELGFATVINLKGSQEYRDWLADASAKTHITSSTITRLAYADWAKKMKLPPPPEI